MHFFLMHCIQSSLVPPVDEGEERACDNDSAKYQRILENTTSTQDGNTGD